MEVIIQALHKYCMNDKTFDEIDFRRILGIVLDVAQNLKRVSINLPFQIVGRTSPTATLLLANILACIANRSDEHRPLEVLVLDHLSDTTVTDLCNNPSDVSNAITAFAGLKHLVLSIKRQEARNSRQIAFAQQLWFLIRKAIGLESLCIIGWNSRSNMHMRRRRHAVALDGNGMRLNRLLGHRLITDLEWMMLSLPYDNQPKSRLQYLRCLECMTLSPLPKLL